MTNELKGWLVFLSIVWVVMVVLGFIFAGWPLAIAAALFVGIYVILPATLMAIHLFT